MADVLFMHMTQVAA